MGKGLLISNIDGMRPSSTEEEKFFQDFLKDDASYSTILAASRSADSGSFDYLKWFGEQIVLCNKGEQIATKNLELLQFLLKKEDEIHIIGGNLESDILSACFQLHGAGFLNFKVLLKYCFVNAEGICADDVVKIFVCNFGSDCIQY